MDGPGISRALERMAHGIVARFPGEPLAIVGLLSQGDVIARRLVDKVKELGVVPSFFAAHVYHWGDVHVKNFGAERAARISPAGAALERDIPFTFHQDTPVLPPDMLETVWCGVNRLTRSGVVLGPEQKIPVVEALAAVTIRAAWQYFEEGEKGSLREGKRADLVLLERDPLTADPMSLRDIPVLATWKDGRLIYRREG